MNSLRFLPGVCLALVFGSSPALAAPATMSGEADPLQAVLRATFKITDKHSSGTCFLVSPPGGAGRSKTSACVVTAAHTLEGFSASECWLVMRVKSEDGSYTRKEIPLTIRRNGHSRWVRHPHLDVAAIRIELPSEVEARPLPYERLANSDAFPDGKIRLGNDVWIFCYPAQLEADAAGQPILRQGTVASLPPPGSESKATFLVDFTTFGGDSGAPVVTRNQDAATADSLIIGLVVGMQRQTDKYSLPFEERTIHYPLGLAITAPAAAIRDTIARLEK